MNKVLKIIRAILIRLGIWWEMYYIMVTDIDIEKVNSKLKDYSVKTPYKVIELKLDDFFKGDLEFCTLKKMNKYKKWFQDPNRKSYGVIINDELAYSSWISFKDIEITNKTKLNKFDNYALLQDAYTNRKYRGIGLHNYVNLYRLKMIFEYGKTKAIGIVRTKNIPALKTQNNSDLNISCKILLISCFGYEFIKYFNYESK